MRLKGRRSRQPSSSSARVCLEHRNTHCTDGSGNLNGGGLPKSGIEVEYLDFLEEKLAAVIAESRAEMVDATMHKSAASNAINSSMEDLTSAFNLLSFYNAKKELLGTIGQWNAHPTILQGNNNYITAGYIGTYRKYMEEKHAGVHVFMNGILGGVFAKKEFIASKNPFYFEGADIYDTDVREDEYLKMVGVGYQLYKAASNALSMKAIVETESINLETFEFSTKNKNILFKLALRTDVLEDRGHSSKIIESKFYHLKIGSQSLLFVPGEITPEAYLELEAQMDLERTLPIGIANDWLGYILTREQWDDSEYSYFKTLAVSKRLLQSMKDAVKKQ